MPAKERIDKVLHKLNTMKGIEVAAVMSREGLLISSTMSRNADTFGAMSAAMFGAAVIAARELGKGELNRVIVETKYGKLVASGAGLKALLVVMARDDSSLGQILLEVSKASEKIKEIFKESGYE